MSEPTRRRSWISRTVVGIALATCFSDFSHEMVTAVLPLYLAQVGLGAAALGIIEGIADFLVSMGRSNDAILFGGRVHLYVDADDEAARDLALKLPSSTSRDYGRPFAQVFQDVKYDFYKIDPMLFAPASVTVSSLRSGRTFRAGRVDRDALVASFGIE